jgi:hypothetical protein
MHPDILSERQIALLPLIRQFSGDFYLAGGTAVALHIGHRRSLDFDLFTEEKIQRRSIQNKITSCGFQVEKLLYEAFDQMHMMVNGIKVTFFSYPFPVAREDRFQDVIQMPALPDLAAMKAFALGGRGKWKDYIDLYFLLKFHLNLGQIIRQAEKLFGGMFNAKLFCEQLSYFEDIDHSEEVEFLGERIPDQTIKNFLIKTAMEGIAT